MIVRKVEELHGTGAEARTESWTSTRLLLRRDGMGFTLTDTVVQPGMDETLQYKNHLEACYCIEGRATVQNLDTGETFEIVPGTMYALDRNDQHRLQAHTELRLICVFLPALTGQETHDAEGSYSLPAGEDRDGSHHLGS